MDLFQHILRSRAAGLACAIALGFSAQPLLAGEGGFMKPLPDGWWHLSMEDIRAGEDRELARGSDGSVQLPDQPLLNLQEPTRQNRSRTSKNSDWGVIQNTSDTEIGSARREMRQSSPSQDSTESDRDTTLRDYTTTTTRALQKAGTGGTNLFRAMAPTLPVKNIDVGLFNRTTDPASSGATGASPAKLDNDSTGQPKTPSTTDVIATLPGSSYYGVPSSPLDVVKSSIASSQAPALPGQSIGSASAPDSAAKPTGNATVKSATSLPPAITTANPASGSGTSTAKAPAPATPQSLGWVQGAYPQQGFQPAGASQPFPSAIRRPGGPNSSGFYEPKSISDLQMGR